MRRTLIALFGTLAALGLGATTARAAFAGHNGVLAVEPVRGGGEVLVTGGGAIVRRLCVQLEGGCAVGRAQFSPDGRDLAIDGPLPAVVDLQGNCVDCAIEIPNGLTVGDFALTFEPRRDGLDFVAGGSFVDVNTLLGIGLDGYFTHQLGLPLPSGYDGLTAQDWSTAGDLAVSSQDEVFLWQSGHLRNLGSGSQVSLAPAGDRVAAVRGRWIWILSTRTARGRRLVRGSAPAFSPDGRQIAFIASGHRVEVIPTDHGRAHRLGRLTGRAVAWDPAPTGPARCTLPSAGQTIASAPGIRIETVSENNGPTRIYGSESEIIGCASASGQPRVLLDTSDTGNSLDTVNLAAANGQFAAFVVDYEDLHYGGSSDTVLVDNVATGRVVRQGPGCPTGCTPAAIVVAPDGRAAALDQFDATCPDGTGGQYGCAYDEIAEIADNDPRPLDITYAPTTAGGAPPTPLTHLRISGQTLSWQHGGLTETATLP